MYYRDRAGGARNCHTCGKLIDRGEYCYREYEHSGMFVKYKNKCLACAARYFVHCAYQSKIQLEFIAKRRAHGKTRLIGPRGKRIAVLNIK